VKIGCAHVPAVGDRCAHDGGELVFVAGTQCGSSEHDYIECSDCGRRWREETRLIETKGPDGLVLCARLDVEKGTRCDHTACIEFREAEPAETRCRGCIPCQKRYRMLA